MTKNKMEEVITLQNFLIALKQCYRGRMTARKYDKLQEVKLFYLR